jgi:hypothetical protein
MTDKQRAEFVERWLPIMPFATGYERNRSRNLLDKMLLEYDKLNGDKWARLKEFVRTKAVSNTWELDGVPFSIEAIDVKTILAEILRLEKEGK